MTSIVSSLRSRRYKLTLSKRVCETSGVALLHTVVAAFTCSISFRVCPQYCQTDASSTWHLFDAGRPTHPTARRSHRAAGLSNASCLIICLVLAEVFALVQLDRASHCTRRPFSLQTADAIVWQAHTREVCSTMKDSQPLWSKAVSLKP